MKCFNCENEYDANQFAFCPKCNAPHYAPQPVQQVIVEKKKGHGCLIVFLIFLFLFVCGTIGLFMDGDSDNKDTTTSTISTTQGTTLSKKEYKDKCKSIDYKELARNPHKHEGEYVKFTGEVTQVVSDGEYRISVTKNEYGLYEDAIYVTYDLDEQEPRILEDDIVTFYGESKGLHDYNSVMGNGVSIPEVHAKYITIF